MDTISQNICYSIITGSSGVLSGCIRQSNCPHIWDQYRPAHR